MGLSRSILEGEKQVSTATNGKDSDRNVSDEAKEARDKPVAQAAQGPYVLNSRWGRGPTGDIWYPLATAKAGKAT